MDVTDEIQAMFDARRKSGGSVFILALWSLFFLGALALAVGALVTANIDAAAGLKAHATARALARAGVELALDEIVRQPTNWNHTAWERVDRKADSPPNNVTLFKENDSLEGGVFSVTYLYVDDRGQAVTNHGVLWEGRKANINGGLNARDLQAALVEKAGLSAGVAGSLVETIFLCRGRTVDLKGGLTGESRSGYPAGSAGVYLAVGGTFRVLDELLLLEPLRADPDLFRQLQPHLTVHGRRSFGGTSIGEAWASRRGRWDAESTVLAESRIDFVANDGGEIEYWHEY